ncbi:MAG: hypothetical protein L0332_14165 [Chloroflexi bacterium]|nr:hypothetical protein [Chloroflexota bacterium]MCI0579325.1 hypothetical protein [Chloroflexota bacterium]MCI0644968.1 hypothetical protein [Chloroflexota bacterium]MCI0727847.1 hypothetical protein [Chloroflexota bacterium]
MEQKSKWIRIFLGSVAVLAVVIIGALAFLPAAQAAASQAPVAAAGALDIGWTARGFGRQGGFGAGRGFGADDSYLAEALGISVEELQGAKEEALAAALEQAVEAGLITQAQADELLAGGRFGGRGWRGLAGAIDYDALLAEALDVTVEELQEARQEARQAAVQAALDAGDITQEEADAILAAGLVKEAIDENSLVANALGLTVEEYRAARLEGTSLSTLIDEAGLTEAEFGQAVDDAYQAAVQQLVEGGDITQEQADLVLSGDFHFGRGFGDCPGRRPDSSDTAVEPTLDA